jgi:hypothetical protein
MVRAPVPLTSTTPWTLHTVVLDGYELMRAPIAVPPLAI